MNRRPAHHPLTVFGFVTAVLLPEANPAHAEDVPAVPALPAEPAAQTPEAPAEPTSTTPGVEGAPQPSVSPSQPAAPRPIAPAVTRTETSAVDQGVAVDAPATGQAPQTEAAPNEQSSWTDHVEFKGDLRYRVELLGVDRPGRVLRHRHRFRARAGLHADVLDDLGAVIQLATGSSDDPVSSNQTLGNAFSDKPIWLDMAYFDYHPGFVDGVHVFGGKMKNPFLAVGKSELLWDSDVNPEGLALKVRPELGSVAPFVTAGYLWAEERATPADTFIVDAQAGIEISFDALDLHVLAGGRYVDYMNIEEQEVLWDPTDSFGNTATDRAGDGILIYDYDYNLLGAFVEFGGKVGGVAWEVFGDLVNNAAVDDDGTGWLVGASLGKCKKALDLCGRYIYRVIEADSVVGVFADSDFNDGGTNAKGHEVFAGLQLADSVGAGATYFRNKTSIEHGDDFHRFQLDLQLTF